MPSRKLMRLLIFSFSENKVMKTEKFQSIVNRLFPSQGKESIYQSKNRTDYDLP